MATATEHLAFPMADSAARHRARKRSLESGGHFPDQPGAGTQVPGRKKSKTGSKSKKPGRSAMGDLADTILHQSMVSVV